jgi:hypothetical protein
MVVLAALLISWPGAASAEQPDVTQTGSHERGDVILAWNELARDVAFAEDQFLTFKGQRALALMHLAMHDALNTVAPLYERYAYSGPALRAHPVVAAAQAAYDVLLSLYPDQQQKLSAERGRWIDRAPGNPFRDRGVELGHAAAVAILERRSNDGWDTPGTYEFRDGPGQYQTEPPWNGFVVQPGFRFARPFVLRTPEQFRPPAPPVLESRSYARALAEVRAFGAVDSTRRTPEQTAYAVWWMEFAESSVNRLARQLARTRNMELWTAARLFAHIATALFDVYVGVWDGKYEYNLWRPFTAVAAARAQDANLASHRTWEPLRPTPPHPEYPSGHAAGCAASFAVLEHFFGKHQRFVMDTITAPPEMPTRAFTSFRAAAAECADSRVRLGWHFRFATDAGLALGRNVARYTLEHSLRRLHWRDQVKSSDGSSKGMK